MFKHVVINVHLIKDNYPSRFVFSLEGMTWPNDVRHIAQMVRVNRRRGR